MLCRITICSLQAFFPLSQGIIPSRDKSKWNTFSAYLHHFSEVDISCSGAVGATEDAPDSFQCESLQANKTRHILVEYQSLPRVQYGISTAVGNPACGGWCQWAGGRNLRAGLLRGSTLHRPIVRQRYCLSDCLAGLSASPWGVSW